MKKQQVAIGLSAAVLVGAAMFGSAQAQADEAAQPESLIDRIAESFDLDREAVVDVFQEHHQARRQQRGEHFEERMQAAVEAGKLTPEQKAAVEAKHEEMQQEMQELWELEPEERRERMREHHEEMQQWAEDQGLEWPGSMMQHLHHGRGKHMGRGMMGMN